MSLIRTGHGARRRGATRRRRKRRLDWTVFDRWLDRIVVLAVVTALVVGGLALALSLFI